jgi:hypothetical protein
MYPQSAAMKGGKGCDDRIHYDFPTHSKFEEEGVDEYENECEYDTVGLWGHHSDDESRGETKSPTNDNTGSEPCHNNQDTGIVQEDNKSIEDDTSSYPPSYLMKAILAGLYELPPKHILQYQTGWGRRIRYHHVRHISHEFHHVRRDQKYHIRYMTLRRYQNFQLPVVDVKTTTAIGDDDFKHRPPKRATQCHELDVYYIRLLDTDNQSVTRMNEQLRQIALEEEQQNAIGMQVSNAGGTYHGLPNFFLNLDDNKKDCCCRWELYQHVRNVIEHIEHHQQQFMPQQPQSDTHVNATIPTTHPFPYD